MSLGACGNITEGEVRVLGGILSGQRHRVMLGTGCSALCLSFLRCEAGACVLGFLPLATQDGKSQASHPT